MTTTIQSTMRTVSPGTSTEIPTGYFANLKKLTNRVAQAISNFFQTLCLCFRRKSNTPINSERITTSPVTGSTNSPPPPVVGVPDGKPGLVLAPLRTPHPLKLPAKFSLPLASPSPTPVEESASGLVSPEAKPPTPPSRDVSSNGLGAAVEAAHAAGANAHQYDANALDGMDGEADPLTAVGTAGKPSTPGLKKLGSVTREASAEDDLGDLDELDSMFGSVVDERVGDDVEAAPNAGGNTAGSAAGLRVDPSLPAAAGGPGWAITPTQPGKKGSSSSSKGLPLDIEWH